MATDPYGYGAIVITLRKRPFFTRLRRHYRAYRALRIGRLKSFWFAWGLARL